MTDGAPIIDPDNLTMLRHRSDEQSRELRCVSWLLAFAAFAWVLVWPDPATACSCREHSAATDFADSEQVFVGAVTSIQGPDQRCEDVASCMSACPEQGPCEVTISMRVLRSFKGTQGDSVEVTTTDPRNECGVYFEVGREYLVFGNSVGPTLFTMTCLGTYGSSVAEAEKLIRELRGGPERPPAVTSGSHCFCRAAGYRAGGNLWLLLCAAPGLPLLRRLGKRPRRAISAATARPCG